jgi:hypothetical protein
MHAPGDGIQKSEKVTWAFLPHFWLSILLDQQQVQRKQTFPLKERAESLVKLLSYQFRMSNHSTVVGLTARIKLLSHFSWIPF